MEIVWMPQGDGLHVLSVVITATELEEYLSTLVKDVSPLIRGEMTIEGALKGNLKLSGFERQICEAFAKADSILDEGLLSAPYVKLELRR